MNTPNLFPKTFALDGALILTLALLIRIPFLISSSSHPAERQQAEDSRGYLDLAQNLNQGLGFGRYLETNSTPPEAWIPELYRTPGYPWLIAMTARQPNQNAQPMVLLQQVIELAICFAVFAACYLSFGRVPGIIAGILAALDFQGITLANMLLTETTFALCVVGAALAAAGLMKRRGMVWGAVTGLLLGASVLIRPTTLYLPIFIGLFLVANAIRRRHWRHCATALVVLVTAYAPVVGWMARNQAQCGTFALSSMTQAGGLGPAASALARAKGIPLNTAITEVCDRAGVDFWHIRFVAISKDEKERIAKASGPILRQYPTALAKEYVVRTANLVAGPEKYELQVLGFPPISFGLVDKHAGARPGRNGLGLALLGLQVLFTLAVYAGVCRTLFQAMTGRHFPAWVWASFWFAAYIMAISAAICVGDPRYRWPAVPLLIMVAAASFTRPRPDSGIGIDGDEEKLSAIQAA